MTKQTKAEQWNSVIKGHEQLDPLAEQDVKKSMMLERFQAEVRPGAAERLSVCPRASVCRSAWRSAG